MAKPVEAAALTIDGREIRVTHPDKPYFSQVKLSKLDLVRYFLSVAPGAIAGIRGRPLVLKRFVNGADGQPFYQTTPGVGWRSLGNRLCLTCRLRD